MASGQPLSDEDAFNQGTAAPAAGALPAVFVGSEADPSLGAPSGGQTDTVNELNAAGGFDRNAPAGSPRNPMGVSAVGGDVPPGAFYLDINGLVKQAPASGAHFEPQAAPSADAPAAPAPTAAPADSGEGKGPTKSDVDAFGIGSPEGPEKTQIQKAADVVVAAQHPELQAVAEGTAMGFQPEIVGAETYVATALGNFLATLKGEHPKYSAAEAAQAMTDAERAAHDQFKAAHPVENTALGIGGALANPVNLAGGEFVGAAPTVLGAVGRGALVGGATGAVTGAGEAGGDLQHRAEGALSGGMTGAVGGGVLGGGGRLVADAIPASAASVAANTQAARGALDDVGVGQVPPATQAAIGSSIAAGGHPVDSAFRGIADTLPTPVPLSVGQASRDPALQMSESLALKGAKGTPAQQTAQAFRDTQQDALQSNTGQIRQAVSGGQNLEPGEGGVNLSNRLNSARDYYKGQVDKAYDAARASPPADLTPEGSGLITAAAKYGLKDFDPRNVPKVAREVSNIEAALAPKAPAGPSAPALPGVSTKGGNGLDISKFSPEAQAKIAAATGGTLPPPGVDSTGNAVRDIFDARARLSELSKTYPPTPTSTAARRVIDQLDLATDAAVKQSLFSGDTAGVQAWKDAIGARRQFGRLFEGNDLIDTLTDRVDRGGVRGTLKVPADQAVNYILGREGLTGLGNTNSARDLGRLGDVLGRTSDEFQGIKGEIVQRLFQQGEKTASGGGAEISGAKLATAWNNAQRKYPGVISGMFSQSERDLISRLVTTAHVATVPVPGGVNNSDTFTGISGLIHRAGPGLIAGATKVPVLGQLIQAAKDQGAQMTTRAATFGASARPAPSAGGLLTPNAFAGVAGQEGASALAQLPGPQH